MSSRFTPLSTAVALATAGLILGVAGCAGTRMGDDTMASADRHLNRDEQASAGLQQPASTDATLAAPSRDATDPTSMPSSTTASASGMAGSTSSTTDAGMNDRTGSTGMTGDPAASSTATAPATTGSTAYGSAAPTPAASIDATTGNTGATTPGAASNAGTYGAASNDGSRYGSNTNGMAADVNRDSSSARGAEASGGEAGSTALPPRRDRQ